MNVSYCEQLLDAVVAEDVTTVEHLLKLGADVNCLSIYKQTPLELAIDNNLVEMTEYLLKHGGDANFTKGNSLPLIAAIDAAVETAKNNDEVESDSIVIVELLLNYGANILQIDPHINKTPYEFAKDYHIPAQRLFEQRLGLPPAP